MARCAPAAGERSGNLTATGRVLFRKASRSAIREEPYYEATCACGMTKWFRGSYWGKSKNCKPCGQRQGGLSMTVHGLTNTIVSTLWRSGRHRAKKRGIPFSLAITDIRLPETCPVLGIKLDNSVRASGRREPRENAPSLDRFDLSIGYTAENTVVMSYRANVLKRDGTAGEHEAIARFMRAHGVEG